MSEQPAAEEAPRVLSVSALLLRLEGRVPARTWKALRWAVHPYALKASLSSDDVRALASLFCLAAALDVLSEAVASPPLPRLRCIDPSHEPDCEECIAAPPPGEEDAYALGSKTSKLTQLMRKTPELSTAAGRAAAAAVLEAEGAAEEPIAALRADELTYAFTTKLRKVDIFALLRYWGYRSDLHHRKSALPKWDGGEQPARDFSVLRCVDASHPPGCSACAPAPSVNDAASLRLGDGGYQLKLLLLGTPEYASMRDRRCIAAQDGPLWRDGFLRLASRVSDETDTLRGKFAASLVKLELLALYRAWGLKSDLLVAGGGVHRSPAAAAAAAAAARKKARPPPPSRDRVARRGRIGSLRPHPPPARAGAGVGAGRSSAVAHRRGPSAADAARAAQLTARRAEAQRRAWRRRRGLPETQDGGSEGNDEEEEGGEAATAQEEADAQPAAALLLGLLHGLPGGNGGGGGSGGGGGGGDDTPLHRPPPHRPPPQRSHVHMDPLHMDPTPEPGRMEAMLLALDPRGGWSNRSQVTRAYLSLRPLSTGGEPADEVWRKSVATACYDFGMADKVERGGPKDLITLKHDPRGGKLIALTHRGIAAREAVASEPHPVVAIIRALRAAAASADAAFPIAACAPPPAPPHQLGPWVSRSALITAAKAFRPRSCGPNGHDAAGNLLRAELVGAFAGANRHFLVPEGDGVRLHEGGLACGPPLHAMRNALLPLPPTHGGSGGGGGGGGESAPPPLFYRPPVRSAASLAAELAARLPRGVAPGEAEVLRLAASQPAIFVASPHGLSLTREAAAIPRGGCIAKLIDWGGAGGASPRRGGGADAGPSSMDVD